MLSPSEVFYALYTPEGISYVTLGSLLLTCLGEKKVAQNGDQILREFHSVYSPDMTTIYGLHGLEGTCFFITFYVFFLMIIGDASRKAPKIISYETAVKMSSYGLQK